jgi:hypothetical protein
VNFYFVRGIFGLLKIPVAYLTSAAAPIKNELFYGMDLTDG